MPSWAKRRFTAWKSCPISPVGGDLVAALDRDLVDRRVDGDRPDAGVGAAPFAALTQARRRPRRRGSGSAGSKGGGQQRWRRTRAAGSAAGVLGTGRAPDTL